MEHKKISFKNVLFDFDGTMADTEPAFDVLDGELLNDVLKKEGIESLSQVQVREFAGTGDGVHKLRLLADKHGFDAEKHAEDLRAKRAAARPTLFSDMNVPLNKGILEFVKKHHTVCGVASNKAVDRLRHDMKGFNIIHYFEDRIYGARGEFPLKPDPMMLSVACQEQGYEPSNTAYVGDNGLDIQAAKAANMVAIGFVTETTLNSNRQEIEAQGADLIIDDAMILDPLLSK